ncbi:snoaL-like polyketide cyclase [Arenibacter sp. NBRC 103722]|uniref:ester cyclase n=1 Tax=Arenibacter sp. NBRC 103722 TaxID=1113929 RepID=UPI0008535040|nr:ester cyclase [Arenibacter sp. NBRC 103722]GBF22536.1 snoaL-like polyketide cyclase [Arenibacter sp. NBRC 103722]
MKTNEEIFKILIEEGFSKGDVSVFDTYSSPNFVEHQYGFFPPNVEGVKKAINSLHYSFPDFSLAIDDMILNGSKVWGRMTGRGTHKNKFGPLFPTGKTFEITVIDIMRFETGKLIEHWGVPDRLALMEQLGMKPPPKLIMKIMSLLHR